MALQAPLQQHETNGHDAPMHASPAGLGQDDVRGYLEGSLKVTLAASSKDLEDDAQFSSGESVRTFSNFLTSTRPAFYVQKVRVEAPSVGQFGMRQARKSMT